MAGLLLKSFYLFSYSQCQGEKENKLKTFRLFYELVKVQVLFNGMILKLARTYLFDQPSLQPGYLNFVKNGKKMVQQRRRT